MNAATTFSMRDLSRETTKVFSAVRKFGTVQVKSRSGEVFTIAKETTPGRKKRQSEGAAAEFFKRAEERLKLFGEMGYVSPKAGEWDEEQFNRIIAGEE